MGARIIAVVFVLLLVAPATLALTGHAGFDVAFIESTELRHPFLAPPATQGALATGGWERDAEREIADAFPLRRRLIEAYFQAKFAWLGDVASTRVIKGRDGWLFLGDEERQFITGLYHPSDAELASTAELYAGRAEWCRRHGIAYVLVLVPNKSTIYANELPAGMQLARPTPTDRLTPLLKARGVHTIDVRTPLAAAATKGEVYSKGDTHWNDAGAYVAYRAIADGLHDAGVRETITRNAIAPRAELTGGDLLTFAGIAGLVRNRVIRYDFPHRAQAAALPVYPNDPDASAFAASASTIADPALRKAVLFGDSFTAALGPFLAESFRRLVILRHVNTSDVQFDPHVLTVEKPTVVIDELVERSLVVSAGFKR